MKKGVIFVVLVIIFCVWCFACSPAGPKMKEGLWEITVRTEMPGLPMQMGPQSYTQCLTKKNAVPQQEDPREECKIVKQKVKGDTVFWSVECKTDEGVVTSEGSVTYKGDTMEGIITMKHKEVVITQHLSGRWIGECRE